MFACVGFSERGVLSGVVTVEAFLCSRALAFQRGGLHATTQAL